MNAHSMASNICVKILQAIFTLKKQFFFEFLRKKPK